MNTDKCVACDETDCWCTFCGAPCSDECDQDQWHPRVSKREADEWARAIYADLEALR